MTTPTGSDQPGPADDAEVAQSPGEGSGLTQSQPTGGGHEREVGVTAAVERGPAELSDEGELERGDDDGDGDGDGEPARSTDEL